MIEQEFEEMVITGIKKTLKQGTACTDEDGYCIYTAGGLHCIIGNMMSPEEQVEYGGNAASVKGIWGTWKPNLETSQLEMLFNLQKKHDELDKVKDPDEFRAQLMKGIRNISRSPNEIALLDRILEKVGC
jgi:hypothetical protein